MPRAPLAVSPPRPVLGISVSPSPPAPALPLPGCTWPLAPGSSCPTRSPLRAGQWPRNCSGSGCSTLRAWGCDRASRRSLRAKDRARESEEGEGHAPRAPAPERKCGLAGRCASHVDGSMGPHPQPLTSNPCLGHHTCQQGVSRGEEGCVDPPPPFPNFIALGAFQGLVSKTVCSGQPLATLVIRSS